jgi:hypothetical protein
MVCAHNRSTPCDWILFSPRGECHVTILLYSTCISFNTDCKLRGGRILFRWVLNKSKTFAHTRAANTSTVTGITSPIYRSVWPFAQIEVTNLPASPVMAHKPRRHVFLTHVQTINLDVHEPVGYDALLVSVRVLLQGICWTMDIWTRMVTHDVESII